MSSVPRAHGGSRPPRSAFGVSVIAGVAGEFEQVTLDPFVVRGEGRPDLGGQACPPRAGRRRGRGPSPGPLTTTVDEIETHRDLGGDQAHAVPARAPQPGHGRWQETTPEKREAQKALYAKPQE